MSMSSSLGPRYSCQATAGARKPYRKSSTINPLNHDLFHHLLPRSRAEMALMTDLLQPRPHFETTTWLNSDLPAQKRTARS